MIKRTACDLYYRSYSCSYLISILLGTIRKEEAFGISSVQMSTILRRWTQFQTSATFNSQLTRCKRFCTKGSDDHDDGKKKDTLSEKEPIKSRHDIAPVNSTDLSDEEFKRRYYNEEHVNVITNSRIDLIFGHPFSFAGRLGS